MTPQHSSDFCPPRDEDVDTAIADYLDAKSDPAFDEQTFLEQHAAVAEELQEFIADQRRFVQAAGVLSLDRDRWLEPSLAMPAPGSSLKYFGDYLLLEEIARGGMGVIYRARQTKLNRTVAVKLILAGQLASEDTVDRFYTEAKAAAQLTHPNIVAIHEVGQYHDQHYFSMDYIEGTSLHELIQKQLLPIERSVKYVKTVAQAIEYAHRQGVLHRDLKPSNILVDQSDQPRVTDFGLAKQITSGPSLTTTGQILGTPSYMSPEQAEGKQVGPASDVYSLGVVLYELLSGRPPFRAATPVETILQVRQQEPMSPRLLNAAVARDLETICLKCLQKDPKKRYCSAAELAADLDRYQDHRPIAARRISPMERTIRWSRRNPALTALAAVLLFAFVGVTVQWGRAEYYSFQSARAQAQLAVEKRKAEQQALEAALAQKEAIKQAKEAYDQADLAREAQRREQKNLYIANMNMAIAAAREGNLRRAADLIEPYNDYPPTRSRMALSKHRSFDWFYLWRLIHDRSALTFPHGGWVQCASFYDNGQRLVSLGQYKQVKKWDAETGSLLSAFEADSSRVFCSAVSPDENELFTLGTEGIRVWSLETNRQLRSRRFEVQPPRRAVFSPDCRWLALDEGGFVVKLIDTPTGQTRHQLQGHDGEMTALTFSPDSQRLASCAFDRTIRVWQVSSGLQLYNLEPAEHARVYSAAFSADGTRLAVGTSRRSNDGIDLWDLESGELIRQMTGHDNYVVAVAFSPDGRSLITGSRDQTIGLWDVESGIMTGQLTGHSDHVEQVGFLAGTERVYSAGRDGTARVWSLTGNVTDPDVIHVGKAVLAVSWSPDGLLLASGTFGWGVTIYNASGEKIRELRGHEGAVQGVEFSPDGSLLASCSTDKTIRLWSTDTWETVGVLTGHEESILAVTFSRDSRQLASSDRHATIRVWDVAQRRETRSAAFPDENGKHNSIFDVAFSADGTFVAGAGDAILLLDLTLKEAATSRRDSYVGDAVEFSPDGVWLATSSGSESIRLRKNSTGRSRRTFSGHANRVRDLVFTSDGQALVSCSRDGSILVWDVSTGSARLTLTGHTDTINALAITNDGRTLASASRDGTIRLWRAASADRVLALTPPRPDADIGLSPQLIARRNALTEISRLGGRTITDPSEPSGRVLNVYLEGEHVNDETLRSLAPLKEMRVLSLRDTSVTGAGLPYLVGCQELRSIVLLGNHTVNAELKHLALFSKLESLQLGRGLQPIRVENELQRARPLVSVDDNAMKYVADLPTLRYFALDNAAVTERGLEQLNRSTTLGRMQVVRTPTIDERAIASLRLLRPDIEITLDEPFTPKTVEHSPQPTDEAPQD